MTSPSKQREPKYNPNNEHVPYSFREEDRKFNYELYSHHNDQQNESLDGRSWMNDQKDTPPENIGKHESVKVLMENFERSNNFNDSDLGHQRSYYQKDNIENLQRKPSVERPRNQIDLLPRNITWTVSQQKQENDEFLRYLENFKQETVRIISQFLCSNIHLKTRRG